MEILHRDNLRRGGFAGLREHQLVMDPEVFGGRSSQAWSGIGNFVYLADARFFPRGETHMHGHREIDVISVMVKGRITHEGSLENGAEIEENQVQVQRAGGEGFRHNEINPDDAENRMIQIWVTPEVPGQRAGYKVYSPQPGVVTRIYGGSGEQDICFPAKTVIEVAMLAPAEKLMLKGPLMAYLTKGGGTANQQQVGDGDLMRAEELAFEASSPTQLILIHLLD